VSKIASVRAALNQGGVPELTRRTRLWTAARIYPGTIPAPRPPAAKKAAAKKAAAKKAAARKAAAQRAAAKPAVKMAAPPALASEVVHAVALAWFEGRRANYERLAAAVGPYVDPDGVFYDVGANIGFFTRVLAEKTAFRGTVHLFEPVPNLAKLCATTLAGVPFTAHIHEFGLSNEDATIDIFADDNGNLGWNTIVADRATEGMARSQIQVRAFNGVGIGDVPSFIKIDVEGAEHRVLAGMRESLVSWPVKPVILCEIGWGQNHPQWAEELAAFAELAAIGYRTVDLNGEPLDVSALAKTTDVLFLPAGR
jgi:FkbM family methyltransferase